MNKPVQHTSEPYWDWIEIQNYIEKKYQKDLHNYKNHSFASETSKENPPYCNFLHWITAVQDNISNGSFFYLSFDNIDSPPSKYEPDWVKEILRLFKEEFCKENQNDIYCYVSW